MNQKEVLGNVKEVKGRMEEAAGVMTGIPALEKEGADQRALGVAEAKVGRARENAADLEEAIDKATDEEAAARLIEKTEK